MKNIRKIIGISAIIVLFLFGTNGISACTLNTELIAGQDIDAGIVVVKHPTSISQYMYVTYYTKDGWKLTETNLAVATSLDGIPQTKKGNPKIGHFPYKSEHDPAVTKYTFTIDLDDYLTPDPVSGKYQGQLTIAAHAVVQKIVGDIVLEETAWADTYGQPFGTGWALYFNVTLK